MKLVALASWMVGVSAEAGGVETPSAASLVLTSFDEDFDQHFVVNWGDVDEQIDPEVIKTDGVHGETPSALRVRYNVKYLHDYGGNAGFRRQLAGDQRYSLQGCSEISFWYKVVKKASIPQVAQLRFDLIDGSEWQEENECYYSFHDVLDDEDGKWHQRRVKLVKGETENFQMTGWYGVSGNQVLDKDSIRGFVFEFPIGGNDSLMGQTVSGEVLLDGLQCEGARVLESAFMVQYSWPMARRAEIWPWPARQNSPALTAEWAFSTERSSVTEQAMVTGAYHATPCLAVACEFRLIHALPEMAYYNLSRATNLSLHIASSPLNSTPSLSFRFALLRRAAGALASEPFSEVPQGSFPLAFESEWQNTNLQLRLPSELGAIAGFQLSIEVVPSIGIAQGSGMITWGGVQAVGDTPQPVVNDSNKAGGPVGEGGLWTQSYVIEEEVVIDLWSEPGAKEHNDVYTTEACAGRCEASPDCIYFALRLPAGFGNCLTSSRLNGVNVLPGQIQDAFEAQRSGARSVPGYQEGGWMRQRRPQACTACSCSPTSIVCTSPGIQILPTIEGESLKRLQSLSVSGTGIPMLTRALLGPAPALSKLDCGPSVSFVDPALLVAMPPDASFSPPSSPANLLKVAGDAQEAKFSDVCCDRSDNSTLVVGRERFFTCHVAGGAGVDCHRELGGVEYTTLGVPLQEVKASDPYLGESTKSPGLCCEQCRQTPQCSHWMLDTRSWQERTCIMMSGIGPKKLIEEQVQTLHAGYTPEQRSAKGVRTSLSESEARISEAHPFAEYNVTLQGEIMRGSVWVTVAVEQLSELAGGIHVRPPVLVFFNGSLRTRRVRVIGNVSAFRGAFTSKFQVTHNITACDFAWHLSKIPRMQITIIPSCAFGSYVQDGQCTPSWTCICSRLVATPATLIFVIALAVYTVTSRSRIKDIKMQGGKWVLETSRPHSFIAQTKLAPVVISGTRGCYQDGQYLARVHDERRLELFAVRGGEQIKQPMDTSHGFVSQPISGRLFRKAFIDKLPVPLAAYIAASALFLISVAWISVGCCQRVSMQPLPWVLLLSAAVGVLVGALGLLVRRRQLEGAPIDLTVSTYLKSYASHKKCARGPGRAITAGQFETFSEHFAAYVPGRNMYYVVADIVLSLTESAQISMAELIGSTEAIWFVSHFWGSPFHEFVQTVTKHASRYREYDQRWQAVSYWVCSFSINQWSIREEVGSGDWHRSSFYKTLRSSACRGTLMVLDSACSPLSRSWCLFEVLQTFELQKTRGRFDFLFGSSGGVLNCSADVSLVMSIAQRVSTLDLRNARASDAADKQMIEDLVEETGGFRVFNRFVRQKMHETLQVVQRSVEASFKQIEEKLLSQSPEAQLNPDEEFEFLGDHSRSSSSSGDKTSDPGSDEGCLGDWPEL